VRIRNRFLNKMLLRCFVLIVRLLFRSCRKQIVPEADGLNPYVSTQDRRHLYCVWHDQLLMTVFSGKPQDMAGLVSRHRDGGYLADAMELVGVVPVRGSTSRGGGRAMRELLRTARDLHIAITPDGPRGPRRVAKSGIVFLASHSGRTIVPIAFTCRRFWKFRGSWTDMMIPKPFTTIVVIGGVPLDVPSGLDRTGLQQHTARLQAEMQRLEEKVQRIVQGQPPGPIVQRRAAA